MKESISHLLTLMPRFNIQDHTEKIELIDAEPLISECNSSISLFLISPFFL